MMPEYSKYSLIREDTKDLYNKQHERRKLNNADLNKVSMAGSIAYFTGIDISLLEAAIDSYGILELRKYIYSIELSESKRNKLILLLDLYNKIYMEEAEVKLCTNTPAKVADYIYSKIGMSSNEKFYILYLTTKCNIIGGEILFIGGINQCCVDIPTIFKKALVNGACNIIISHCHPSGDSTASKEDKLITKRLIDAGNILGIPILDHIILGDENSFTSLREEMDWNIKDSNYYKF